jgi:hypothetical protein
VARGLIWLCTLASSSSFIYFTFLTAIKMKKLSTLFTFILFVLSISLSAQHLKKDGTPDRRYKENKTVSSTPAYSYTPSTTTSSSSSTTHLKKDGTPDRRYKENQTSTSTYTPPATTNTTTPPKYEPTNYSYTVKRDSKGNIVRSASARRAFMKSTGYANGRPGYVVDHIKPLKRGGCDCPENMQWQTIAEAKAKDRVEK